MQILIRYSLIQHRSGRSDPDVSESAKHCYFDNRIRICSNKTNQIVAKVTLAGWLPVYRITIGLGGNAEISTMGSRVNNPATIQPGLHFTNYYFASVDFFLWQIFSVYRPALSAEFANNYIYIRENKTYDYGQTLISGRLYFNNYSPSAIRDIYPGWAQVLDYTYTYAPFDKNIYGSISTLKTAFYFRG